MNVSIFLIVLSVIVGAGVTVFLILKGRGLAQQIKEVNINKYCITPFLASRRAITITKTQRELLEIQYARQQHILCPVLRPEFFTLNGLPENACRAPGITATNKSNDTNDFKD